MRAIAAALLLLGAQDEERLVEQLSDEDITVRERAAEKLLERGAAARPALEKAAKSGDPEVALRAKSLLGEIALAEGRRSSLGPAQKIRLAAGTYTLADLARRVEEQSAVAVRLPEAVKGASVRLADREMHLLEFLDHVSAVHGGIRPALRQPADAFAFEEGKPWNAPVKYSSPFRVWIDRLRLERRDPFDTRWERGSMVLGISWQPNVRPISTFYAAPRFRITELVGDDGKALETNPGRERLYSGMSMDSSMNRSHREFVPFEHPARGVRRLARIRGTVEVLLPLKTETVTFEKPFDGAGRTQKAGDYAIELKSCARGAEGIAVVLRIVAPKGKEGEDGDRGLEIRARFTSDDIEMIDKEGKARKGRHTLSSHSSGGEEGETQEQHVLFPAELEPAALKFRFMTQHFDRRVEFEFKDVELP